MKNNLEMKLLHLYIKQVMPKRTTLKKDYSSNEEIFLKLFDLIDSMPMRKNEILNDQC